MQNFLASYKPRIDTFLTSYLSSRSSETLQINPWRKDAYERISSFVTTGKSIRGSLLLWSIEQYKGKISDSDIAFAASLELIHSGFLIHDDIMDNDRQRRGHKTLFSQYEDVGQTYHITESTEFGKHLALCVGDLALFLGLDCMLSSSNDAPKLQSIIREFSSVCLAQMQDVSFGMNKELPSKDEVLSMYTYKTARYTISLPLCAGARISKSPQSEVDLLERIGEDMGIIFQLTDDMLNLFGDPSKSGKPVGSDLLEEKKTFAYVTLMNTLTQLEIDMLKKTTEAESRVSLLYKFMRAYDIHTTIMKKIDELSVNVSGAVRKLSLSDTAKQELVDFCTLLKQRST